MLLLKNCTFVATRPSFLKQHRAMTTAITSLPNAIDNISAIEQVAGKRTVMFLDYDGTLSPIVARPELAVLSQAAKDAVNQISNKYTTAIVSGRAKLDVKRLVNLKQLYYAGSHGFDIESPEEPLEGPSAEGQIKYQVGQEFIPVLNKVFDILSLETKDIKGAIAENNLFSLSLHYRLVEDPADEQLIFALAKRISEEEEFRSKIRLTYGKKVIEVRPNFDWHKGKAVVQLLEFMKLNDPSLVRSIFVGDDRTDEDAFKALRDNDLGIGILVASEQDERVVTGQTSASYFVKDTSQVVDLLHELYVFGAK
ncbi:trehalose 6-phosphate phosphatase [Acrasis kona]|uniref:Trehalose 6-phosphate phosphatase n=1 Tax=Acrasis kona TaxID=1008807 RepID=A0AAW2ZFS7_9EUKA